MKNISTNSDSSYIIDNKKIIVLDNIFNTHFGKKNSPGGVFGIFQDGKLVYKYINGYSDISKKIKIDEDTLFDLASVSKHVTAMTVKYLHQNKVLNLNDLVEMYLTEFKGVYVGEKLTIEHLLNMVDGLSDYMEDENCDLSKMTLEDAAIKLSNLDLSDPMYKHEYSNSAYVLLALIVKRVTQKSFGEVVKQTFFEPLGMKNSKIMDEGNIFEYSKGYTDNNGKWEIAYNPTPYLTGDGNIYMTFNDMCIWENSLHKHEILSKEVYNLCLDEVILKTGEVSDYKHGWYLIKCNDKIIGTEHTGSWDGTSTYFCRYLNGFSMFLFSNIDDLDLDPVISQLKSAIKTDDCEYELDASDDGEETGN